MPIELKNRQQVAALRRAGQLVAGALEHVRPHVQPGVTTYELDRMVEEYIRARGGTPSYKGYRGGAGTSPPFPGTICASVNEVICHGFPSKQLLREGDIVGVDVGAYLDGWCGDICATYAVGPVASETERLLAVAAEALERGITAATPDGRTGDIGAAIQAYVEAQGCAVVREYNGHGIGRKPHDEPTIRHHGKPGLGLRLRPGLVFTIEPMVNLGRPETRLLADGWTVVTADGSLSAQFEHTIVITEGGAEILSLP